MPRIYASDNDPVDFCADCFRKLYPDEESAFEDFGHRGDGPDGRGNCFEFNAEHPPYDDSEIYVCSKCGAELTEEDY